MKYLLDVNAVVAHLLAVHVHHARARTWCLGLARTDLILLTPVVELGFLRVGLHTRLLPDIGTGQKLLRGFAAGAAAVDWLPDTVRASTLPKWARTAAQVTDGHLLALAEAAGAQLATFDRGIPGAFRIP